MTKKRRFKSLALSVALVSISAAVCMLSYTFDSHSEAGPIAKRNLIKANDKLTIQVRNEADLSGVFDVNDTGKINYPFLGEIQAEGLTVGELKGFLLKKLGQDYLVNPNVFVEFKERPSNSITIVGRISKPGSYVLADDVSLLQMMSQAGGVTEDPAQIRAKIIRSLEGQKKDFFELEIEAVMKGAATDPKLESGDMIFIYATTARKLESKKIVSIMGQIGRQGNYEYTDGMMFIRLMAEAGGFTPVASTNNIRLIRHSETGQEKILYISAGKIMDGKAEDIKLESGDLIIVPESFF